MKKFFSILLSAALIVSLLTPMGVAWAEEADDVVSSSEVTTEEGTTEEGTTEEGTTEEGTTEEGTTGEATTEEGTTEEGTTEEGTTEEGTTEEGTTEEGTTEEGTTEEGTTEEQDAGVPELLFINPDNCNHDGDTYTVLWPKYETADYQEVNATTHRVTYETEEVTRCLSCGWEITRVEGTPYTYTENHYYDENGDCICGAHTKVETGGEEGDQNTCEHINCVEWVVSDQDSFHGVSLGDGFHQITSKEKYQTVCMDCGKVVNETDWIEVSRTEPHYITSGVCDACGYKNECTHSEDSLAHRTVLLGTAVILSTNKTGHVMQRDSMIETYCTKCGDVLWTEQGNVVKQEESHVFVDGKCTECGYEINCSHAHKSAQSGVMTTEDPKYTYVDEKTHKVDVCEGTWYTCLDCGESWFEESSGVKTITESHDFSGGTCFCGTENSCTHSGGIEKIPTRYAASLVSSNASGHTIRYSQYLELRCADCGELINIQMDYEQVEEISAHTYVNGTCSECGYVQPNPAPTPTPEPTPAPDSTPEPTEPATTPAATRPTEPEATEPVFTEVASDEPVHGVKVSDNLSMTETVTKVIENIETSETAKIQIRNVDQILNQEEAKQMETIPVKEQVFAFLTVMGFGDTIEKALDEADEQMSQKTLSLIESIQTRMDNMTQQERKEFDKVLEELFPITKVVIDGVEYEWFQFEIQVEDGDTVRIERYGFRLEDGEWILSRLETADVEK